MRQATAAVRSGVTFSDIFEVGEMNADGTVPAGFKSINTEPGHEVLRVRRGMETRASRLETRRYAAMMGGTTEFRKEEGITYDVDGKVLYIAMSEVAEINGFSYIMSVIQHPFGESDSDKLVDPAEAMAYTGYIGPMPAMD